MSDVHPSGRLTRMHGVLTGDRDAQVRRRYHFHWPGVLYIVVTVFLALGAFNSQNNLLFWALGLAFGGLIVSGAVSGWSLLGVEVHRRPVAPGEAGETMAFHYVIHNTNRFMPAFALHVEEADAPPGERTGRGAWRRYLEMPRALALHVGPGQRTTLTARPHAVRRGEARLAGIRVWTTFPFGITRKSVTFAAPERVLVRPKRTPVGRWPLAPQRGREGRQRAVSHPGRGDDFYGLREYRPGDPARMVAQRPSARLGELVVRTTTAHSPRVLWVVVRLEHDSEDGNERAISLAAGLISEAHEMGYDIGLSVPAADALHVPRGSGRSPTQLYDALARLDCTALARESALPACVSSGQCIVAHADGLEPLRVRAGGGVRCA